MGMSPQRRQTTRMKTLAIPNDVTPAMHKNGIPGIDVEL